MNRLLQLALPCALLTGCGLAPDAELADDGVRHSNAGFVFDTRALTPIPAGTIPTGRLPLAAYDAPAVERTLIQTDEPFASTMTVDGRIELDSTSFTYSADRRRGMVLAVSKTAEGNFSKSGGNAAPIPSPASARHSSSFFDRPGWT